MRNGMADLAGSKPLLPPMEVNCEQNALFMKGLEEGNSNVHKYKVVEKQSCSAKLKQVLGTALDGGTHM